MRYLGEDEAMGYVGELYEDLDGQLYGWVEGVDEWGDPIGSWHGLSQPEVPALGGLGALYAAPDGTVYQVQGLAAEEAAGGGQPGPRAQGPRRPPGRPGPGGKGGAPRKKKGGFFKKLLPIAKFAAGLIPGAGAVARAGIDVAEKALTKPGVAGLGALYAAPDGTVYQVQGLEAEDLDGLYADEELRGFAADEELRDFRRDLPRTKSYAGSRRTKNYAGSRRTKNYVGSPRMKSCADLPTKSFEGSTKAMSGRPLSTVWRLMCLCSRRKRAGSSGRPKRPRSGNHCGSS